MAIATHLKTIFPIVHIRAIRIIVCHKPPIALQNRNYDLSHTAHREAAEKWQLQMPSCFIWRSFTRRSISSLRHLMACLCVFLSSLSATA